MSGWEYLTRQFDFREDALLGGKYGSGNFNCEAFDHEANRLGWEGWELVSLMDTNSYDGETKYVVATFKRPLTAARRQEIVQSRGTT